MWPWISNSIARSPDCNNHQPGGIRDRRSGYQQHVGSVQSGTIIRVYLGEPRRAVFWISRKLASRLPMFRQQQHAILIPEMQQSFLLPRSPSTLLKRSNTIAFGKAFFLIQRYNFYFSSSGWAFQLLWYLSLFLSLYHKPR